MSEGGSELKTITYTLDDVKFDSKGDLTLKNQLFKTHFNLLHYLSNKKCKNIPKY